MNSINVTSASTKPLRGAFNSNVNDVKLQVAEIKKLNEDIYYINQNIEIQIIHCL